MIWMRRLELVGGRSFCWRLAKFGWDVDESDGGGHELLSLTVRDNDAAEWGFLHVETF
jgi:hypothetical protein